MSVSEVGQEERFYLNRAEAARFLRLSQRLFDRLCGDGKIPACRIGRRVTFDRADLVAFADSCKV